MGCSCSSNTAILGDDETELPSHDFARLLHFGSWLLGEGTQSNDVVFVLLLVAGARNTISASLMARFSNAFRRVRDEYTTSLKDETVEGDGTQPDAQRFGRLSELAKPALRKHWKRYCRTGAAEKFCELKASFPEELAREAAVDSKQFQRVRSGMSLVESLLAREGREHADLDEITLESESRPGTLSEATTPAERIMKALPLVIQAVQNTELALKKMMLAVETFLGKEPLSNSEQVERCQYNIPAGGCAYVSSSPGEKPLAFQASGVSLLASLCDGRAGLNNDVILEELADCSRPATALSTNSKSGEIFLISAAGKFVIKTISDSEAQELEAILPSYVNHVQGSAGSMLCLYVGLFRIDMGGKSGPRYFTIMHSVFDSPVKMDRMYDLKGSTHHRCVKDASETVRKDEDWLADGCKLTVSVEDARRLSRMHQRDTAFLSRCQIIDFSVLIGICNLKDGDEAPAQAWVSECGSQCYFIGIVDVLIEYGLRKRLEHLLHTLKGVGDIASVTDPESYTQRQQKFFAKHVLPASDASVGD